MRVEEKVWQMTDHRKLKLKAVAAEDIEVVSTLLQDGLIAASDLRYLADEASFVMVINRYCWELSGETEGGQPHRCLCGIRVGSVRQVSQRGLSQNSNQFYNLLSITYEKASKQLTFTFSDGYGIRLAVDEVSILVQDMADPHPGFARPHHDVRPADKG